MRDMDTLVVFATIRVEERLDTVNHFVDDRFHPLLGINEDDTIESAFLFALADDGTLDTVFETGDAFLNQETELPAPLEQNLETVFNHLKADDLMRQSISRLAFIRLRLDLGSDGLDGFVDKAG